MNLFVMTALAVVLNNGWHSQDSGQKNETDQKQAKRVHTVGKLNAYLLCRLLRASSMMVGKARMVTIKAIPPSKM